MIYIDVSHLIGVLTKGGHLTGIQRITFNAGVGLAAKLGYDQVRLLAFSFASGKIETADVSILMSLSQGVVGDAQNRNSSKIDSVGGFWSEPQFSSGDKVLMTEWFWNDRVADAFQNLKSAHNLQIWQFVHDVLPMALPDYFFKSLVKTFSRRARNAMAAADIILTNSDYSAQDIRKYCGDALRPGVDIKVLKLPHEFSGKFGPLKGPRILAAPQQSLMGDVPFALMVGTVENRKNTHLAVKAWHRLSRIHGRKLPKLVLIGNFSWIGLQRLKLMTRLFVDRWHGGPVIHMRGCNDAELELLYRNCMFSIYLSDYEGWGLPIGESLWFGRPVLSGMSTSLPEVGGDLVDYVAPHDSGALVVALEKLCFNEDYRVLRSQQAAMAKLRSWESFVNNLVNELG